MNEYLGNCVINFNGAAFTGTVSYVPEDSDNAIPAHMELKIDILKDFLELAAAKLNCSISDIELADQQTEEYSLTLLLYNPGGNT